MFDSRIATCPPRAHFQFGLAERRGALISRSFEAAKRSPILSADFPDHHLLACVCVAKNLTPLSNPPIAPSTLLNRRVGFLRNCATREPLVKQNYANAHLQGRTGLVFR